MPSEDQSQPPYLIKSFDKDTHDQSSFSCGIEDLDSYLKETARQDLQNNIATVCVMTKRGESNILGYYTLSNSAVDTSAFPSHLEGDLPNYSMTPATLLGRLTVDKAHQNRGLGKTLLFDALQRSYKGAEEIASFSVVVDANDNARSFYLKYNFQPLPESETTLYLPIKTIEGLL
jgi:predicted GNAT family N-acyltransferase